MPSLAKVGELEDARGVANMDIRKIQPAKHAGANVHTLAVEVYMFMERNGDTNRTETLLVWEHLQEKPHLSRKIDTGLQGSNRTIV